MGNNDWIVLRDNDAEQYRILAELADDGSMKLYTYRLDKTTGAEYGHAHDFAPLAPEMVAG